MKKKDVAQAKLLAKGLQQFIHDSPTPFHAVENIKVSLTHYGFKPLLETENWECKKKGKYYVQRNGSIIAFQLGDQELEKSGFRIIGAHTDSPCLKVKSNPDLYFENYLSIGVETYGGVLLSTWFDRDLSLAGRVSWLDKTDQLQTSLIHFKKPVACLPNLAIHLNRNANENRSINKQNELSPILLQFENTKQQVSLVELLQKQIQTESKENIVCKKVLSFDLYFCDTQKPSQVGYHQEFINSPRLDNLLSCYIGMQALQNIPIEQSCILVCNDHEEVGSVSESGAASPFLQAILERVTKDVTCYHRTISNSIFLSVDNAHAVHPNYKDKHDGKHWPIINKGPVIKINANQRYATNSRTNGIFQTCCLKSNIPFQTFINRNDLSCGSTIGPISASKLGVSTLDIGVPTFAMHSIREMCGVADLFYLKSALNNFYHFKNDN